MSKREDEELKLKGYTCLERDHFGTSGVLLDNEIRYYAENFGMIELFNPDNLKPAAYELTIGDEYSINGEIKKLDDEHRVIIIKPFQVVIIKTGEIINLPRFIIARWNIKVSLAYKGLLWVGGPQVDPGWVGHLSCPIYNLSDKDVTLRIKEPLAVMDFVKTTPFKEGNKLYNRPPKRILFSEYEPDMKSALFSHAKERIDEIEQKMEKQIEDFENKVGKFETKIDNLNIAIYTAGGIMFTAIAALVTALAIFVSSGDPSFLPSPFSDNLWIGLIAAFSIFALIISLLSLTASLIGKRK